MQSIKVTRYADPAATHWAGYIEPADKGWIAYIDLEGRPLFFLNRDPETGAVLSDDPAKHEAEIAEIRRVKAENEARASSTPPDGPAAP